jgi:hypothetical protein
METSHDHRVDGEVIPPSWVVGLMNAAWVGKPTILLLDEVFRTPKEAREPLLHLIRTRRFASWELPAETEIILTTNSVITADDDWDIASVPDSGILIVNWK